MRQTAFDQPRTKTGCFWRRTWSAAFGPDDLETRRLSLDHVPAHTETTLRHGERSIFARIGSEFIQHQPEVKSAVRLSTTNGPTQTMRSSDPAGPSVSCSWIRSSRSAPCQLVRISKVWALASACSRPLKLSTKSAGSALVFKVCFAIAEPSPACS